MKQYEDIAAVRLQNPISWSGQHSTDIKASANTTIAVDAEAEIVTLTDKQRSRVVFVPFDNVVCLEQAPPKPIEAPKPAPTVTEHQFKTAQPQAFKKSGV